MRKCAECDRTLVAHYWGKIRAHSEGWFTQKDGTIYCPDHTPKWAKRWRKQKAEGKDGK